MEVYNYDSLELSAVSTSCSITRDDITASFIENGNHLIRWNGDTKLNIWIDKYDVRTLLTSYESFRKTKDSSRELSESLDEDIEYERYQDMLDFNEEDLLEKSPSVDNDNEETDNNENEVKTVPNTEPYILPKQLNLPDGVTPPALRKQYEIIIHTAKNTRESRQLEIFLKLKQADNPVFEFLKYDCQLHSFYQVILLFSHICTYLSTHLLILYMNING
mmetsp:Transcript_39772/g.40539  ORF Transcript_39772/g.40539 Transcript_39772/m.40539 type:complete len:219 (-) Transcript_39772:162-818(-)